MKVLWVCNVMTSDASKYRGKPSPVGGGWLSGLSESLQNEKDIDLVYCYPKMDSKTQDDFQCKGIHYYSFYSKSKWALSGKFGIPYIPDNKESKLQRLQCESILSREKPDVVHIFGTEFYQSLVFAQLVKNKDSLVCSIQGLTSESAEHYLRLIPSSEYKKLNISALLRGSLAQQRSDLSKRGENEIECLKLCNSVVGRTEWDKACTYFINPKRNYYFCNETLRHSFYEATWSYDKCSQNVIFISQASSPLKGFNMLVEALNLLQRDIPDIRVRVAGTNFIEERSFKDKLKISTYGVYVRKLIQKYHLEKNFTFLGNLDETKMVQEYLNCNVFVSASSIENSPNSVGEAMLLGVPVISSDVGGVSTMLKDNVEGLLYPADDFSLLAYRIKLLLEDSVTAVKLGKAAREKALITHNPVRNKNRIIEIYHEIYNKK